VDGIITDYPSTLRDVMADRGWALPKAYPLVEQPQFGRGAETRADPRIINTQVLQLQEEWIG
jgi:glycerophosphoryl diester phosphodiesterase